MQRWRHRGKPRVGLRRHLSYGAEKGIPGDDLVLGNVEREQINAELLSPPRYAPPMTMSTPSCLPRPSKAFVSAVARRLGTSRLRCASSCRSRARRPGTRRRLQVRVSWSSTPIQRRESSPVWLAKGITAMARGRIVGRSPGGPVPPATEHPGHMIANTARQQTAVPGRFMISPTQFDRGIVGDYCQVNSSAGAMHQAFPRTPQVRTSGEQQYPGSDRWLLRGRRDRSLCLSYLMSGISNTQGGGEQSFFSGGSDF